MAGLSDRTETEDPSPVFEATVVDTGRSLEHAEMIADTVDPAELPEVTELEEADDE